VWKAVGVAQAIPVHLMAAETKPNQIALPGFKLDLARDELRTTAGAPVALRP
jgi:hypothetical protein